MDVISIPFAFPGLPNIRCAFQTRQAYGLSSAPSQESPYAHSSIGYRVGDDYDRVTANRESLKQIPWHRFLEFRLAGAWNRHAFRHSPHGRGM